MWLNLLEIIRETIQYAKDVGFFFLSENYEEWRYYVKGISNIIDTMLREFFPRANCIWGGKMGQTNMDIESDRFMLKEILRIKFSVWSKLAKIILNIIK